MLLLLLACVPKTPEIPAPTAEQAAPIVQAAAEPEPEPGCVPVTTETWEGDVTVHSPWGQGSLSPAELDGDPQPEAILYLQGTCGSSGMCEHQVLDACARADHYRSLGRISAQEWRVSPEQTNGYFDLIEGSHWLDANTGAVTTEEHAMAFNGTEYVRKPEPPVEEPAEAPPE